MKNPLIAKVPSPARRLPAGRIFAAAAGPGLPSALTAKGWGFQDVLFRNKPLARSRPYGSYVMENVLFKIAYPAEFHAQTAVECAIRLHPQVRDRLDHVERIVLTTHRYMREDVAIGLSFMVSAGELAGVPTPLARAFLAVGSAICGEDFWRAGRTLENLGLGGMDRGALQRLLQAGFA